jgi:transcriptional regulator with XRE-family HTH domain
MGSLANLIRKAMLEQEIKQLDIMKLSGGVVNQSTVSTILRGVVPSNPSILDAIANVINVDPSILRKLAVSDIMVAKSKMYNVELSEVCRLKQKKYRIPLYSSVEELSGSLSKEGYPEKKPRKYIDVAFDYGEYAYALYIKDSTLAPRVYPGETVILSQDIPIDPVEDYAVVSYNDKILMGKARIHSPVVIVEQLHPYSTELIQNKDINFMHKIVCIHCIKEEDKK